ncbi:AraC family transcriptional regulator [Mesorhizobium sp. 10J20-29]
MNQFVATPDILANMEYSRQEVALEPNVPFRVFLHGQRFIPFHWHREVEIICILRGQVRLSVSGQICEMSAGDVMLINANDIHDSRAWSSDAVVYGIHLDAEYFERSGLAGFSTRRFRCKSFLHGQAFDRIVAPIRALIARIILTPAQAENETFSNSIFGHILAYYIMQVIDVEDKIEDGRVSRPEGRERVLEIMKRVREAEVPGANLASLAVEYELSVSHLSRQFKRHIGIGFQDYVQNLRLDRAAWLLRNTDANVADVMMNVGYANPTHFFSKFKERLGCSPAKYRDGGPSEIATANIGDEDERRRVAILLKSELAALPAAFNSLDPQVACTSGPIRLAGLHDPCL